MTTMGQCYAYAHNRLNRLFFLSPRSRPGSRGGAALRSESDRAHRERAGPTHQPNSEGQVGFIRLTS